MTDHAPFEAAVLRDNAVEEMEQEIRELRQQVRVCQRIEIRSMETSDTSSRAVLAQAQLDEGQYESGGNLFRIPFKEPALLGPQQEAEEDSSENEEKKSASPDNNWGTTSCPLMHLCNLRVTLGGVHQGQLSSITDFRPDYNTTKGNSENSKGILLTAQSQQLAILMIVHGWPKADWAGIDWVGLDPNHQEALDALIITLPQRFPDATVTFDSVYLFADRNQGAIRNLPAPVRASLEQGLEESQSKFVFVKLVTNRMRFVLDEEEGESLVPQVERVLEGLAMLDIACMEDLTAQNKQTMEYVIQMHKISMETTSIDKGMFEACINGLLLKKQRKLEAQRQQTLT